MKFVQLAAAMMAPLFFYPCMADVNVVERIGYAYKLNGDELLYTEQHQEWVEDGKVIKSDVTYKDPRGNVIAGKSLDFSDNPTGPEFRLTNEVNGHLEGAERKGGDLVVFFRKSDDHEYVEERVQLKDQAIIDGGFDRFIETNWESLLDGKVFKRPFLVPSFQRFIDFKIYLARSTDADIVFVMEPDSIFLRIIGDQIVVTYNRQNTALRRYEGISNIRDRTGENYEVRVEFPGAAGDARTTAAGD